jgi:hypothetical protein
MISGATQLRKYQFSIDGHEPLKEYFEEQYSQEPCQEYHDEQNHADEVTMDCDTSSAVISRLFSKARRSVKPVFTTCNEMKVWPVLKFCPCDHCTEHRPYRAKSQRQAAACTDRRRRIVTDRSYRKLSHRPLAASSVIAPSGGIVPADGIAPSELYRES